MVKSIGQYPVFRLLLVHIGNHLVYASAESAGKIVEKTHVLRLRRSQRHIFLIFTGGKQKEQRDGEYNMKYDLFVSHSIPELQHYTESPNYREPEASAISARLVSRTSDPTFF